MHFVGLIVLRLSVRFPHDAAVCHTTHVELVRAFSVNLYYRVLFSAVLVLQTVALGEPYHVHEISNTTRVLPGR